jgi:catechol 2,3-dioxygenase-like lactoylglutathione lyase family enzyme
MQKEPEKPDLPRALGLNHVALEVRDIDEELAFLSALFQFELRSRDESNAFIELGDQFIALFESTSVDRSPDGNHHFGLVVDDRQAVRERLTSIGIEPAPGSSLDFRDPSGNLWQIVEYAGVEFLKNPAVLAHLGARSTLKTPEAIASLESKGISPGG